MIITENIKIGKTDFTRNYSDAELLIRSDETGELYEEAWDPAVFNRTYTETDLPIYSEEYGEVIEDEAGGGESE